MKLSRLVIVVDFNIPIDDGSDLFARRFISIMDSLYLFNYLFYHYGNGNPLDLIFSLRFNIDCICLKDIFVSDHRCSLSCPSVSFLLCG